MIRNLEVSGIVGEQVEVISDADLDARTARWVRGSIGEDLEKRVEKELKHLLHGPEKRDVGTFLAGNPTSLESKSSTPLTSMVDRLSSLYEVTIRPLKLQERSYDDVGRKRRQGKAVLRYYTNTT